MLKKLNKIEIIKSLDRTVGNLTLKFLPTKNSTFPDKIESVLIIRPGGIGDAVLLVPMIRKIEKIFSEAKIHILAEKRNVGVFDLFDCNCKIFRYDEPNEFLSMLKYKKYDLVFDTEQWHILSSVIARYVGRFVVGFDTNERRKNLDIRVGYSHTKYEVESFLDLLEEYCKHAGLNIDRRWSYPFLDIKANRLLYDIVIFTGASIKYRKWDVNRYIELINKLNELNLRIALIGAKSDVDFNKKIAKNCRVNDFTGKTSLKETAKIMAFSKLLFSTDSGVLHIGAALGVKTVSLFGPGIEYKWAPKGKNHKTINRYLPCSPCTRFGYTPRCPYWVKCMKGIDVESVLKTLISLL
ncbi:glycosyltransferase family 9 protein [Hippea alviniae]|uniref:glycosyltransferase family 9 protein n=1 Tax=Hippea alviniae TaxID=1279027 RepID=UPI0003B5281D|nr:glycosyltransferase family 9 protein [Hippea alviniae]